MHRLSGRCMDGATCFTVRRGQRTRDHPSCRHTEGGVELHRVAGEQGGHNTNKACLLVCTFVCGFHGENRAYGAGQAVLHSV